MRIWYYTLLDNNPHVRDVRGGRVRIGSSERNDIVLPSPFVAKEAAVLYRRETGWELHALTENPVQVGDATLYAGGTHPVSDGHQIKLYPYTLMLDFEEQRDKPEELARRALEGRWSRAVIKVHAELLDRMDIDRREAASRQENDEYLLIVERNIEELARLHKVFSDGAETLSDYAAGLACRGALVSHSMDQAKSSSEPFWAAESSGNRLVSRVPARESELSRIVAHISERLGLTLEVDVADRLERIDDGFWAAWADMCTELHSEFKRYCSLRQLKKEVEDIIYGYGPLEDLLQTPTVSEIMVVDSNRIYVEKNGVVQDSGRRFISDDITLTIIERIVSKVGRRIDKSRPLVDARLADGSRVNAVIPPLAVSGPCLTIRKFPDRKLLIDDLVRKGSLTHTVAEFLRASVLTRKNILIAGGTGTGKTTLLNCLSDFIPDRERIVTVEDTAELQLNKEHVVRLETRESNIEGSGAYTIRDLVKNSLRMRPDRIVVGECRGAEALDMLQAMNTGHDGSLTTIHANSAADVVLRLEVLVQMAADLPVASIHRQVASAIDLVVQLTRLRDGRRIISEVTEILGVDEDRGGVQMKQLFVLDVHGSEFQLVPTGAIPTFMSDLIKVGMLHLESFYLD